MAFHSIFSNLFQTKSEKPSDVSPSDNMQQFGNLGLGPLDDEIWGRYAAILDQFAASKDAYWDELCLPASKEKIAKVIRLGLLNLARTGASREVLNAVKIGYLGLANFQPLPHGDRDIHGVETPASAEIFQHHSRKYGELALDETIKLMDELNDFCDKNGIKLSK